MQTLNDEGPAHHVHPMAFLKFMWDMNLRGASAWGSVSCWPWLILMAFWEALPTMKVGASSSTCHLSGQNSCTIAVINFQASPMTQDTVNQDRKYLQVINGSWNLMIKLPPRRRVWHFGASPVNTDEQMNLTETDYISKSSHLPVRHSGACDTCQLALPRQVISASIGRTLHKAHGARTSIFFSATDQIAASLGLAQYWFGSGCRKATTAVQSSGFPPATVLHEVSPEIIGK